MRPIREVAIAFLACIFVAIPAASQALDVTRLVSGLEGAVGSTIGPGGALYVTEGTAGRISRVDPKTGAVTTFASGLPQRIAGTGGAMDVAFIGSTAYVLVTLVGPDVGGSDVVGIYRVDGPNTFTVIADIGQFAIDNPPNTLFFVPTGVRYALGHLPWGISRHRRSPQPRAQSYARWRGQRVSRVRQHRPNWACLVGERDIHGRGRPGAPHAEDDKVVVFDPKALTHRGRVGRSAPRGCGIWPWPPALRARTRRLQWWSCGRSSTA